jgi:hypothetical protein
MRSNEIDHRRSVLPSNWSGYSSNLSRAHGNYARDTHLYHLQFYHGPFPNRPPLSRRESTLIKNLSYYTPPLSISVFNPFVEHRAFGTEDGVVSVKGRDTNTTDTHALTGGGSSQTRRISAVYCLAFPNPNPSNSTAE